ncbi:AAA family ATPase [Epidermidibacterium keratini]|uniref:Nuclease SbcCD subunit C n=1 Tax=Epidermidibacterium keratini TaxID=1891644 RepID=A0A7L4YR36_9ACTN|nr:SMC family ATPase [Epidermidibacterium keratini]QHC01518.1 AAA family ATPase [Epidermidibacterium keratini]
MRLHALTLQAIGPYADRQHVDFDALSRDGLFLFTGPTGVGKSTILDAVTFSLYGSLPGARSGLDNRLKSDFADADVRPFVELEFSVGDRRMKLTRSPEYDRPKRRGDGLTRERSSVALEQWTGGEWVGVEGGRKEAVVAEWIEEHLRLGLHQFSQVVVLPQGQFAQFLHCKDSERESLLSSLFQAERYRDVEKWFEERARVAREDASEASHQRDLITAKTIEVAELDPADAPGVASDDWYADLLTRSETVLGERSEIAGQTRADAAAALSALQAAERTCQLIAEYADLTTRADALQEQRPAYELWSAELADARKVEPLRPMLAQRAERAEAVESARTALDEARSRLELRQAGAPTDDLAALKRLNRRLAHTRGGLDAVITAEESLDVLAEAVTEAQGAHDEALSERAERQQARDELPGQLTRAREQQQVFQDRAAVQSAAAKELAALREAREAAVAADELQPALAAATRAHEDAREEANDAKEVWLELAQRHLDGFQAQLAAELVEGQACGVCGSCSHPQPARVAYSVPSAKAVDDAKAHSKVVDTAREAAAHDLERLQAKHAGLRARAGGRELAVLDDLCAEAERALADADEAARQLPELRGLIAEAERALASADDDLRAADRLVAETQTAVRTAHQRLRDAEAEVVRHRGDFESVAEHAAHLDESIVALEEFVSAAGAHVFAVRESEAIAAALATELVDRGLADLAHVEASLRTEQQQAALHKRIGEYDAEQAAVAAQLRDSRFAELPEQAPDLPALRSARDATREAEVSAASGVLAAQSRIVKLTTLREQAAIELAGAEQTAVRAQRIDELAKLMRGMGPNTKGMTLTSYFLAARLDEVAAVASAHLLAMTSGRYELEHTDERQAKRGRGGLGLRVIDNYTGVTRTPQSLSGGETFTASLALALALADVVTAEAGAMSIDSLFIDEGFGSLDADYLDAALNVLDGLREAGRTIGVISHVEEMKHRIPAQLVIERDDRRSRIRAHA